MTLQEIKTSIENGHRVYWDNATYEVIKDYRGQYFIKCLSNNHCIGLTWSDEVTMNGKEEDFTTELPIYKTTQKEYYLRIKHLGINTVTCGNCGGVLFHNVAQQGYLTCPHCLVFADQSDFPDLF